MSNSNIFFGHPFLAFHLLAIVFAFQFLDCGNGSSSRRSSLASEVRSTSIHFDEDMHAVDVLQNLIEPSYFQITIHKNFQGRNALKDQRSLWPNATVPYELSKAYDARGKFIIANAMAEFHKLTCIRFITRGSELSYISIAPGRGCSAVVGRTERRGRITFGKRCYTTGTAIHELMHSLGFVHEHNRPDRDDFVTINHDNIDKKFKGNFKLFTWAVVQNLSVAYDFESIMHYGKFDFAKNRSVPVIVPRKAGVKIGQRNNFSKGDLLKINRLYNCEDNL